MRSPRSGETAAQPRPLDPSDLRQAGQHAREGRSSPALTPGSKPGFLAVPICSLCGLSAAPAEDLPRNHEQRTPRENRPGVAIHLVPAPPDVPSDHRQTNSQYATTATIGVPMNLTLPTTTWQFPAITTLVRTIS